MLGLMLAVVIFNLIFWSSKKRLTKIQMVQVWLFTLLPEPWGYFHYGWWNFWYSVVINSLLLLILWGYYKWILKLEMLSVIKRQRFN